MSIETTSTKESSSDGEETETVAQHQPMNSPDSEQTAVPIADLLRKETDLWFAGLTEADVQAYPDDIPAKTRCWSSDPLSFKTTIKTLPQANPGELWATNDFVTTSGEVDIDAIRRVHGLDVDVLEAQTGTSIEALAARNDADPAVQVRDHKDIVDERRKALNALGYDVKFRWQIATDSYTIINPQEAYLPIISALQQRGDTDVFGWISYRDWGGLLKMVVICPNLRHVVEPPEQDIEDFDEQEIPSNTQWRTDDEISKTEKETVVYGGFQTGYDFRGTQTLWARPILFFPESGTVLPDTGERYTRRHYGKATDTAHERANDRVPINEWWRSIYDDIDLRMTDVDEALYRTRAITYDFEDLPFSLDECYTYWGVAKKYAERAAERARAIANPSSRPTVFNIQLSLLIALLEEYEGSMASNSYQEYLEVAGELFRKPAMMIQLAMKEHDRRADDESQAVLPDEQQTLSDALADLVAIPGIEVGTEVDLSDQQAQRVQNRVQKRLDEST